MSFTAFWKEARNRLEKDPAIRRVVPTLAFFQGIRGSRPAQYSHSILMRPVSEDFEEAEFDYRVPTREASGLPQNRAKHAAVRVIEFELELNHTDPVVQLIGDGKRAGLFDFARVVRSALIRDWRCYGEVAQGLQISTTTYTQYEQLMRASFTLTLFELEVIEDEAIDPRLDTNVIPTEGSIQGGS